MTLMGILQNISKKFWSSHLRLIYHLWGDRAFLNFQTEKVDFHEKYSSDFNSDFIYGLSSTSSIISIGHTTKLRDFENLRKSTGGTLYFFLRFSLCLEVPNDTHGYTSEHFQKILVKSPPTDIPSVGR